MISAPPDAIGRRARRGRRAAGDDATVIDGRSMIGGGSLPEEGLPTKLLALPQTAGRSAQALGRRLREHDPPVVARIERDTVLLDPRTVHPREDRVVVAALRAALADES